MIRDVTADPKYLDPTEVVMITARVSDPDGISTVYAYVRTAEGQGVGSVELFDDGAHHDDAPGDNIYGNTWSTPVTPQHYSLDILAMDTLAKSILLQDVVRFATVDPPVIVSDDLVLDDQMNHDGIANPGEMVKYRLSLKNVGGSTAYSVTALVNEIDPYVYMEQSVTLNLGDIPAGNTALSDESNFFVFAECPDGHIIPFKLDIDDAYGNRWHYIIDVTVVDSVGPFIQTAQVHPPYVEAGKPVTITAYAIDGSGINSVQAEIESPNESPIATVSLYDDGAHGDGKANDNLYGAFWTTHSVERDYVLDFTTVDGLGNIGTYDNRATLTTKPFSKTTDLLFIVGDARFPTTGFQQSYVPTLDTLGYTYDVWDTYLYGIPSGEALAEYSNGTIIWAISITSESPWQEIQSAIKAYLAGGGRLFLLGSIPGANLDDLSGYLHVTIEGYTSADTLVGANGDPIGGGVTISVLPGYPFFVIAPTAPAQTVFVNNANSGTVAVRVHTGIYKVVYMTLNLGLINEPADQATVMRKTLAWLQQPDTRIYLPLVTNNQ
jgi:hypothetical protein